MAGDRAKINVVMAIQSFRPTIGGAELQLERLLPHLEDRGVRAEILTRAVRGQPGREAIGGGKIRRTPVAGESPVASVVYVAGSLAHILRRRAAVDLVHAHGALSPSTIALGAALIGVPSVVTVLGAGPRGDLARLATKPGGRMRLWWLIRSVSFIALSPEIKQELSSNGVPEERIFLVPNGVDCGTYRPATAGERNALRAELGMAAKDFVGVFAGRLHPIKRLETLLLAAAEVPEMHLLLLGDGSERSRLMGLSERLGLADRVRFVGFTDRVSDFLRASDCFFLPSHGEGMSNALIEAMACGLPCVATSAVGGVTEALGERRGLMVPPGRIAEWSDAMRLLAREQRLRSQLGEAASRFVRTRFCLESVAQMIVDVYEVIHGAASRGSNPSR